MLKKEKDAAAKAKKGKKGKKGVVAKKEPEKASTNSKASSQRKVAQAAPALSRQSSKLSTGSGKEIKSIK